MQYRILGMDCAHDAAEIESAVRQYTGTDKARVSLASHILTVESELAPDVGRELERAVTDLGYQIEPINNRLETQSAHQNRGYRRALSIVVGLNLGFGVIEGIGGVLAGSQALKADALDFLGDGLITLTGLVAIRWSLTWRAKTALAQGVFLGVLGLAVLTNTIYRVLVQQKPDPEAMGVLAAIALVVNLASAAVLLPHRSGDTNVRAVWLFSRNDAIGNLAVLAAAGLVALTATPWPDLVVATLVAALFLHSSWSIIADARRDLRGTTIS
jgi:cation diffusion facilitator family transporter